MSINLTNFYTPNSGDSLRFFKILLKDYDEQSDLDDEILDFDDQSISSIGVADSWNENEEYIEVLNSMGAEELKINDYLDWLDVKNEQ